MLMMMDKQVLHWGGVDNGNMIKKVVDRLWTSGVAGHADSRRLHHALH